MAKAIIERAKEMKLKFTMTGDNGTEFTEHRTIAQELDVDLTFSLHIPILHGRKEQ